MGEVIQLRDFQNPKDFERMRQQMAAEIINQVAPADGSGIDGLIYESSIGYTAPDKDPA